MVANNMEVTKSSEIPRSSLFHGRIYKGMEVRARQIYRTLNFLLPGKKSQIIFLSPCSVPKQMAVYNKLSFTIM